MQLSFDDARFDVTVDGNGSAIVLLHGFPLAKEAWDAQAAALAAHARVVRFDLRGLGKSSVPMGPYLMESLASDVAGVLDALDITRATIVGHSLGGYVAFAYYRLFAERCAGLGIVCSRATADDAATAANREALAVRAEAEGIAPIAEAFVSRYFAPSVATERPELLARAHTLVAPTDPAGAAAMLRGMAARVSSENLFEEIDVPVRVVAGTQDALVSADLTRAIATGIRGAKLDELDCGHFPLWELPDATTASLEGLLRDVAAANGARA
ncbi:MAG: alpha/beta fold hydrolase [Vulcanimicrobiaceae bacterium]